MLSPYKIKWDDHFSTEFNVLTDVVFDSDNGAVETHLSREAVASETYNGVFKRISGYRWNDNFTFQITIVKNDFSEFSATENRQILKWLTNRANVGFIDIYKDEEHPDEIAFCALGNFVNVSSYKLSNGRIAGYVADWESCTPYAMSRLYIETKTIDDAVDNKLTINIDTDDNQPVYPRITINHGYGTPSTPHLVVELPSDVIFDNLVDMADYVENTIYYNKTTNTYYYKSYTPTFTSSSTLPDYVNWTTVEVTRQYTSTDNFAENTFYHYGYENMYYWKVGTTFHAEPSRPVYGDWKTKTANKEYTATDTFEEKTIYSYNNTYYWMAPYNFYTSSVKPNLQTTSVKITNRYGDEKPAIMIIKNNTGTEEVVIDGANRVISTDRTRRIFGDDVVDWQWLPLYDGQNELTIEGNCEVTIEYRTVIKCGEF